MLFVRNDPATSQTYTLSLHDALPIFRPWPPSVAPRTRAWVKSGAEAGTRKESVNVNPTDRKSTRLNSSHVAISYAVFCLKKKSATIHAKQSQQPATEIARTTTEDNAQ